MRNREMIPRKRIAKNDEMLRLVVKDLLDIVELEMPSDWNIYAVVQKRGMCNYGKKYITIPQWAINKGEKYLDWYVAHELSHMFAVIRGVNDHHGPNFMSIMRDICPLRSQHYEYGYKPRNAAMAGLARK